MLTFWQSILISIISSGVVATIIGGLFTYFINRKLNRQQRTMEKRKDLYSETHEILAGFFDGATSIIRQKASSNLLILYRQIQLWGSTDVLRQFNNFLDVFDKKNNKAQKEIIEEYTGLIIKMHEDLTGEKIKGKDIRRYGKIN